MVKAFVAKLSAASNLAHAATFTHSQNLLATTQTKQEANEIKNRNDPGRFFGDGVQFKAKLIGILEVGEARGDRMCQEALQDLKMAIRAAGEHKQRITIHVTIDGLRLRDEKTSDSLYHHPVHKISFIAQDMTDSRAFGYIFGSPDSGHRFFGIKTDKAASQVVLAMRDLFQVVFELKKKEIELARQQIQSKSIHDHQLSSLASLKNLSIHNEIDANVLSSIVGTSYGETATSTDTQASNTNNGAVGTSNNTLALLASTSTAVNRQNTFYNKTGTKELSPESVADLVDLELELSSIQRGITQMERITPNEHNLPSVVGPSVAKHNNEDPFGDSFTNFPTYNLLPPPESGRSRYKPSKISETVCSNNIVAVNTLSTLLSTTPITSSSPATLQPDDDESWLHEIESTTTAGISIGMGMPRAPLAAGESTSTPTQQLSDSSTFAEFEMKTHRTGSVADINDPLDVMNMNMTTSNTANVEQQIGLDAGRAVPSDAFTDLDPLGIGRTRPYIDKKYFFQDLKNPPKRVLKDMSPSSSTLFSALITTTSAISPGTGAFTAKAANKSCAAITKTTTINDQSLNSYNAVAGVVDEFHSKEGLFEETVMLNEKLKQQQQLQTAFNTTMSSDIIECQYGKQQQQHATKLQLISTTTTSAAATTTTTTTTTTLNTNNSGMGLSSTNSNNTKELSVVDKNVVIIDNMMNTTATTISLSSITTNIATTTITVTTTTTTTMSTNKHSVTYNTNICTATTTSNNNTQPNICKSNISSNSLLARTTATQTQNFITTVTTMTKGIHIKTTIATTTILPSANVLANNICFNHYNLDASNPDPVMIPRDTDPFSPTRKKSDPFQDSEIFSNVDPFEFKFPRNAINGNNNNNSNVNVTITNNDVFSGPLQVTLPPEASHNPELALSHSNCNPIARSRPVASHIQFTAASTCNVVAASSALKQQTAEVICSISQKKMPHLFGQARFSKRGVVDSNSINMRRLQESDSLSETETAPEPPPRPDSVAHTEPPPLPPKKQFNDIVIRPRVSSGTAVPTSAMSSVISSNRYEFLQSLSVNDDLLPPVPLPSRRVVRSDGAYPGPGRPRKPDHVNDSDDYMTPIALNTVRVSGSTMSNDGPPPLLPPPTQISTRMRLQRQHSQQLQQERIPTITDIYENKNEILQHQQQQEQQLSTDNILTDITLTQLLTLGIDELAVKLNVPKSKLSTMTLVELTRYLSEFLEKNKQKPKICSPTMETAIFRVNLDQQTTFMAKFDDTFGEDLPIKETINTTTTADINSNNNYIEGRIDTFVANFTQFNEPPVAIPPAILVSGGHLSDCNKQEHTNTGRMPAVPPADRYAVFREIIDHDLQQQDPIFITTTTAVSTLPTTTSVTPASTDMLNSSVNIKPEFRTTATTTTATAILDSIEIQTDEGKPFVTKIDTKITEVVAQAKDRYAALRDIILVENLFDNRATTTIGYNSNRANNKPDFDKFAADFGNLPLQAIQSPSIILQQQTQLVGFDEEDEEDEEEDELDDDELEFEEREEAESSLDSNEKEREDTCHLEDQYEQLSTSTQQLEQLEQKPESDRSIQQHQPNGKFLTVGLNSSLSVSKDDLEIDALMQRAISNLSLDSRDRMSPAVNKPNMSHMGTSPITLPKTVASHTSTVVTQASPVLTELSAVSTLIDSVNKQISTAGDKSPDTWATFESSRTASIQLNRKHDVNKTTALLTLPPAPPSNASQNDTAESPCSSDPHDDIMGGSVSASARGKINTSTHLGGSSIRTHRRWPRKEHRQTSSSSRDLSPWDDELPATGEYQQQQKPKRSSQNMSSGSGYYMRHNRRMNSCDEDYEYEDEYNSRREPYKFKQEISRSRDNFDLASPSWYYYPPLHPWSSQDAEQAAVSSRARSFERAAYERSTYGPAIYDKRGVALPPSLPLKTAGSYERRSAGSYDKRGKYYREFNRAKYDFDEYSESMSKERRYRETDSFEKIKARNRGVDYENVYEDSRLPYKARVELMYEHERKSFDRESIESFESATRRRRSFGSGDIYGCLERSEDSRERYGTEKTRSLRKSSKLRAIGDIDYEQDSESEFQHQRQRLDAGRGLQRPNQLGSVSNGSLTATQTRIRKSSGSSPWDGDEPSLPGQKIWKRPSSAAENERRLTENRRAANLTQTPSGSDGENDRRKQRLRGNKNLPISNVSNRYTRENYNYMAYQDDMEDNGEYADEDYDAPPTDEDKFERINRRRRDMAHQRMFDAERIKTSTNVGLKNNCKYVSGEVDIDVVPTVPPPHSNSHSHGTLESFSFVGGFESDFNQTSPPIQPVGIASSCNSTPAASATTPSSKSAFRFSNDFSERDKILLSVEKHTILSTVSPIGLAGESIVAYNVTTPKLRFDDHVRVSQIEDAAFEDDFSGAHFDFNKEETQWSSTPSVATTPTTNITTTAPSTAASMTTSFNTSNSNIATKKQHMRNNKLQQRNELIKKSESVNIFAKRVEDPFEDDEFFKSPVETITAEATIAAISNVEQKRVTHTAMANGEKIFVDNNNRNINNYNINSNDNFQWVEDEHEKESNFAKFDENM